MAFFKKKQQNKKQIALCLGGGGARGFGHIGALKAFAEADIDFDFCVGTSVGSIIGAIYCAGLTCSDMIRFSSSIDMGNIYKRMLFKADDPKKIGNIVKNIIGDAKIEDLPKRFYAVATDLITAKQVVLDSGSVADAVSASSAVPMFFKPMELNGKNLVDGGLVNNIPADVCKMLGAAAVVTVDVNPTRGTGTAQTGLFDVLKASFSIMNANASVLGKIHSDVFIEVDTSDFKSYSTQGYETMMELGYQSAKSKIEEIRNIINKLAES